MTTVLLLLWVISSETSTGLLYATHWSHFSHLQQQLKAHHIGYFWLTESLSEIMALLKHVVLDECYNNGGKIAVREPLFILKSLLEFVMHCISSLQFQLEKISSFSRVFH